MRFEKEPLDYEAQADRLLVRGLVADRAELIHRLQAVSYYRLSGYLHPFRIPGSDNFRSGTTLQLIWSRYCFDRRLRTIVIDAIERIEVSFRTKLVYHFVHAYGPFGHLSELNLPKLEVGEYLEWRLGLVEESRRSKELFARHFFKKYEEHKSLPLWMAAELMSMGCVLTMFRGVDPALKRIIAREYDLPDEVMLSWFRSLNAIRNICAHHARLWNRVLGYAPLLPNKSALWSGDNKLKQDKCGVILLICRHLLRQISSTSKWGNRVEQLLDEFYEIPIDEMGLPVGWREHPVWTG